MPSILERLPDPSALQGKLTLTVDGLGSLSATVSGFAPGDLAALLDAGAQLPIPDTGALLQGALDSFGQLAGVIPADPQQLTAPLQDGLGQLLADATRIRDVLKPITALVDAVAPLLEHYAILTQALERLGSLVSGLGGVADGLNLANIPAQIAYLLRMLQAVPESVNTAPFKDLQAQIDTLNGWLTLDAAPLTERFRAEIQALAEALPAQLDAAMRAAMEAVAGLDAPLAGMARSAWCLPYESALQAVEAINLDDLSQIDGYLSVLNAQSVQVTTLASTLTQNAQRLLDGLDSLGSERIAQDLQNALLDILRAIGPAQPGALAKLFSQIQNAIGGINPARLQDAVHKVDRQVDKLVGQMNLSQATGGIQEITDRVVNTVDSVQQALTSVATTLASLVADLRAPLTQVDLPGLVNQIKAPLATLSDTVNGLLPQVETLTQQVEAFVGEVDQGVQSLDVSGVAGAFGTLLDEAAAVLDDPDVKQVLDEAQKGVAELAEGLEQVTLKPAFDEVIRQIEDLKTTVAKIDVDKLNDMLKLALIAALAVLREFDFPTEVTGILTKELQDILDQAGGLTRPLEDKLKEITRQIEQFSPGAIVGAQLAPPYDALLEELAKVEPTQALAPLKGLYDALLSHLEPLRPNALLAPLRDAHGQLMDQLEALSPHTLMAPLEALLAQATSVLDALGIEPLVAALTGVTDKLNTLLNGLSLGDQLGSTGFWQTVQQIQSGDILGDAEQHVEQFLDGLVAAIKPVNMPALQPALDAMQAAIATIEHHVQSPAILAQFSAMSLTLDQNGFSACVSDLARRWAQQKARFAALNAPPDLAADVATLRQRLQEMSPIMLLAAPVSLVGRIDVRLRDTVQELARAQAGWRHLLADGQAALQALLPSEATAEGFKHVLRQALDEQIGQPVKGLITMLRQRMASLGGLFQALQGTLAKLEAPLGALTTIPTSIGRIRDALLHARDALKGVNLSLVEDELQGALDDVIAQLTLLDPAALLAELDTLYANTLQALKGLYPEAALKALDTTYREGVLKKIAELDPRKIIAAPLDAKYRAILASQKALDVAQIFGLLTTKLDALKKELQDGLARAAQAFNALVAALPSPSVALPSLDISVDIGF